MSKRSVHSSISGAALLAVVGACLVPLIYQVLTQSAMAVPETSIAEPAENRTPPCNGWAKPSFALFVTGRQHGYIEPCGCTGLDRAKGGLSRRYSVLKQLKERGWEVVPVDVGNQVRRVGAQADIKFHTTAEILQKMGYAAIGFGPDDLRLSPMEVLMSMDPEGNGTSSFVSANASVLEHNPKFKVVEAGGQKIGITAVVGKSALAEIQNEDITFTDTPAALRETVDELRNQDCDKLVLLAHCSTEETEQLARDFPMFDVIVTAGGAGEPTMEPTRVDGSNARIVQAGTKGIYVGVLGFYDDAAEPIKYDRIVLDNRFPDSPEVLQAFAMYQNQLRDMGLKDLGLRPVRHPRSTKTTPPEIGERTFVGHETCGECHTSAYEVYENSPHFQATKSISEPTERSAIKRHYDPECLSCHVTGWNPQGYFPYASGYLSLEESVALHSNGCENCHGPGSAHVAAENGDVDATDERIQSLREEMRLSLEEARKTKCYDCHDQDNSPDFDFDTYWPEVEHHGMD